MVAIVSSASTAKELAEPPSPAAGKLRSRHAPCGSISILSAVFFGAALFYVCGGNQA
jgi:hypothetical protein